jgi:hypothetical protein
LVRIEPLSDEGGTLWKPYRGQPYDPAVCQFIEGGWDHEHCDVCNARVTDGDAYWTNDGPEHVDLCPACFPAVRQALRA